MTDRELLELAAKAAGVTWTREYKDGPMIVMMPFTRIWNPLEYDGDALRLAIQIGLQRYFGLEVQSTCVQATCFEPWEHCEYEEYKTQDPYAATRRAIVRAAAEIGREME